MAKTTSLAFPNMFNIATNQVSVLEDSNSITNRTRLMILTDPAELYNSPDFGVGIKRHLWKYNTDAERGVLKDNITEQLRMYEPCVYADKTKYYDGLLFTDPQNVGTANSGNNMALTVALQTVFKDEATVTLNPEE